MTRFLKWLSIVVIGLITLTVLTVAVALVFIDSPPVKKFITARISQTLGREVTVAGNMSVDWSLQPLITFNTIRVANASWGESPYMAEIDKLAFSVDLTSLLHWRLVFPSIDIDRPRVRLARSGDGQTNWAFLTGGQNKDQNKDKNKDKNKDENKDSNQEGQATLPAVKSFAIDNGEFSFRDPGLAAAPIQASLDTLAGEIDKQAQRLSLNAEGSVEDQAFTLDVGSALEDGAKGGETPIHLHATLADASVALEGSVAEALSLTQLDAKLRIDVPQPSALAALAGRKTQSWPSFHLEARLLRDGRAWRLEGLDSQLGHSRLRGAIGYDANGPVPRITAELNAPRIDLLQILPDSDSGADDKPAQQDTGARVPDIGFRAGLMNKVNADIHLKAASITTAAFELEDALLDATLEAGQLEIRPLELDIFGGRLRGTLVMQAGKTPVRTQLSIEASALELGDLLAYANIHRKAAGRVDAQLELTGQGGSLQPFAKDANGSLAVTLHDGRLANAAWAATPDMATVEKLVFTLDPAQLIQGRFVFPDIDIDRPRLHLARSAQGEANWAFLTQGKEKSDKQSTLPVIRALAIDNGELSYRSPGLDAAPITANIDSLRGELVSAARSLSLKGDGTIRNKAFTVDMSSRLREDRGGSKTPLKARLTLGDAMAKVDGTVGEPASLKALDAAITIDIPEPSTVAAVAGRAWKPWPAFHLEAQILRDGQTWQLTALDSALGLSQLNGSISYARASQPPSITADLYAPKIDLVQLFPGGGNKNEETSAALIPDIGLRRQWLNAMNADIRFETPSFYTSIGRLDNLVLDASLQDGHLRVDPFALDIAGGNINVLLDMQGGDMPVYTSLDIDTNRLDLHKIFAKSGIGKEGVGIVNSQIELSGRGARLPEFLAGADGDIAIVMQQGRIDQMLVELMSQSVEGVLGSMFGKNQRALKLRCMVSDWRVDNGTAKVQRLILDTPELKIVGDGQIDLDSEQIDIELLPRNKDFSPLSAQAPVNIVGSLANPSMSIDRSAVAASLLTPIELGVGDSADCLELAAAARRSLGTD